MFATLNAPTHTAPTPAGALQHIEARAIRRNRRVRRATRRKHAA